MHSATVYSAVLETAGPVVGLHQRSSFRHLFKVDVWFESGWVCSVVSRCIIVLLPSTDRERERKRSIFVLLLWLLSIFSLFLCNCVPVSLAVCRRTEGGCLDLNKYIFSPPATLCNARCAQSALIRDFHLISE